VSGIPPKSSWALAGFRIDVHGNGWLMVVVGSVPAETYELEFFARNGTGCNVV